MQLNIYILAHPIIQTLSNYTTRVKNNNFIYYLKSQQLGTFIVYEVIRQWIDTNNIYIKKINYFQQLSINNPFESYSIITDLTNSYHIITDIGKLLPQTKFKQIDKLNMTIPYETNEKIILFEQFLYNYNIIESIDYLKKYQQIDINQIKVACIICNSKILDQIGRTYPNLEIYTTKIINL